MLILIEPPERGRDSWGSGAFGASRGSRTHVGIDYAVQPGSVLLSPVTGVVTKLGYPYGDDLSFRYVQVTDEDKNRHRFFYVEPGVKLGDEIFPATTLGTVQDIVRRYPTPRGMKPHIHYEIIDANGLYVNPKEYWGTE